jgi:arylsulfatase A
MLEPDEGTRSTKGQPMTTRVTAPVLLALSALVGRTVGDPKPNFVVINIDDLGYADVGPFGSSLNRTPNLDRMAEEGRKLTSFYAAPVCSPSRAALMTGCYPKRALSIPHVLFPAYDHGLSPEEITVAELLKQLGYATACIGKWHLGDQPEFLPTRQGFDYYFGLPYSNDMGPAEDGVKSDLGAPIPQGKGKGKGQPPLPWLRNETVLQRVLAHDQTTLVARYTDEAVQFLRQNKDRPFFLYLPHSAVHFPIYPGKAFQGRSNNGIYGDWVEEVDWSVGQVLDTIRDLGLSSQTLVIFTSDNGGTRRASNAPLRGHKGSTWEGGMRVPTIAWWPDHVPAGTETDAITSMMDILPTFVRLAGGAVPSDRRVDGHDIWPWLAGETTASSPYRVFYFYRGLNLEAVRRGRWKLRLQTGELYDLDSDIGEQKSVAAVHPDVVKRLRQVAQLTDDDLGIEGIGPGCRPLGRVKNAKPLINHDGQVREGFEAAESGSLETLPAGPHERPRDQQGDEQRDQHDADGAGEHRSQIATAPYQASSQLLFHQTAENHSQDHRGEGHLARFKIEPHQAKGKHHVDVEPAVAQSVRAHHGEDDHGH